jgi:hypothetical protein
VDASAHLAPGQRVVGAVVHHRLVLAVQSLAERMHQGGGMRAVLRSGRRDQQDGQGAVRLEAIVKEQSGSEMKRADMQSSSDMVLPCIYAAGLPTNASTRSEDHRQRQGRTERQTFDVRDRDSRIQGEGPESIEKGGERDPRLHPGEMHTEARMDAEAEAKMLASRAEHVIPVGIDVVTLVPIGRPEQERHNRARVDGHSGQLRLSCGLTQDDRDRWLPPQRLFEGLRVEGTIGKESLELGAITHQRQEEVAGGTIGCLDSGG